MSAAATVAPRGEAAGQIRGSSVLLGGRLLAMAVNVGTQVLLVRGLTKADFGTLAYALSVVTFARIVVGLGHNQAVTRFLSVYEERRDHAKLVGTIVMTAGTVVATSAALYLALLVGRGTVERLVPDSPGAVTVLLVVVLLAPVQVLDDTFEGALAVFSKPRSIFVRKYLVAPALRLAVVLGLVAWGAGVEVLAAGYVAAAAAGVAFYAVTLAGVLRDAGIRVRAADLDLPFREYFSFSLPLLSSELVHLSVTTVTVVVLGLHAGVDEVAELRAVRPAAMLNQLAFTTFVVLFRPLAARLHERGDHDGLGDVYWQTAAWLAVVSFPVLAMTGPFAEQTTVTLFGAGYRAAAPYLAVLAVGYYLNAALGFNAMVLQIYGRIRYVLAVNLAVTAASVVATFALVPPFGAMGASVATTATLVAVNVASQAGLARGTGIGLFRADYGPVYASTAVAAGALWLADLAVDPPFPVAVALVGAASVAVFVANRGRLRVGETFPEVRRVPVVGRWLS